MQSNETFKLNGQQYTAVKEFSTDTIPVQGILYQKWYVKEQSDPMWVPVGKHVKRVEYRRPCIRETERRVA